jgi:cytochrome P450
MLRDPRWSSNFNQVLDPASVEKPDVFQRSGWVMLFMDAPEHAHLRRMVAKQFDPQKIANLATYARAVVSQLLDAFEGHDEIDLISEFAEPLSLRVLTRLLGVPDKDVAIVAENAHELSRLVDWAPSVTPLENMRDCGAALIPYLWNLVAQKRRESGDDLVSALVQQVKERKIHYLDVVSTAILMLAAGHVTSTHMLGNGVLALLQDRHSLEACKSGRYKTVRIVDELVRFDGPVQASPRTALTDMELGGQAIRRGEKGLALLGSANRDGSVFADPDKINQPSPNAG